MNIKLKKNITLSLAFLIIFMTSCGKQGNNKSSKSEIRSNKISIESISSENINSESDIEREEASERELFALDTAITLKVYGIKREEVLNKLEKKILELDDLLSTGKADSEVSKLNTTGKAKLSATGTELMKRSLELNKKTGGLFDITIYPLMELWGFTTKDYKVPSEGEIQKALKNVGSDKIIFDEATGEVSFKNKGVKIDFGGIGKGYITDELVKVLTEENVESAIINLGGNVFGLNKKPDGSLWNIAIRDPNNPESYMAAIRLENSAVITSGGYERYFEENGIRYHHILDPRTGKPSNSNLKSVSIVSKDGTLADTLSTSLFIMGEKEAANFWRKNGENFDIILLTDDDRLLVSEGIKDKLVTDLYEMEVINR